MDVSNSKILIVDDEKDIIEFLQYNFEKEGFRVISALNGSTGKELAKKEKPDLIILDIMMPGLDGVELCKELREIPEFEDTLIIFLTARGEDYSQIAGFDVGADDYITKPVRPRVLIARIKALLKRKSKVKSDENTIDFTSIVINKEKREVILEGNSIHIPKIEFDLLVLLATQPGKIFSRDEIYSKVWGNEVFVSDRTLDVHIRKLREKIGKHYIKTIKGVGYGFNE
ncbi:MAG: response regulator transcription factor [Bacteroidales bacterium]|nr:response regulator transcription factor [Bacteroidales bacterium]MCF8402981.1 response regulator transcription factor [Bacteroidales bacterium]